MVPLACAGMLVHANSREWMLDTGLQITDATSALVFRPSLLAPTFAHEEVTPFHYFPINSYLADDPGVDLDGWRLDVSGLVRRPGSYTLDSIRDFEQVMQNTRHICIEGWDVIGNFAGTRVDDFLTRIGADRSANFLEVECADDYYESIDMASARHPQSLLCYEMYGQPLSREHGAPLRLVMPTKLGYKQAKYIVAMRVTNVLSARTGYWEDQGYGWHGGI
jgi:DMSO/TMAO reductase YedYZ molybdopterin-dependent catalytic subunit